MAFVSNILASVGRRIMSTAIGSFSQSSCSAFQPSLTQCAIANAWSYNPCRTNMRDPFPRPKENKRLRQMGFKARMRDPRKRQIIMRRILKNRHLLSP